MGMWFQAVEFSHYQNCSPPSCFLTDIAMGNLYVRAYVTLNLFFRDLALLHCNAVSIFYTFRCFGGALFKPIAAALTQIENPTTLEYLFCLYTRAHCESWAVSLTFTTATAAVETTYTGSAIAGTYVAAVHRMHYAAAVHRVAPIPARHRPT